MASTLADQAALADNSKFQARVRQALAGGAVVVMNETTGSIADRKLRSSLASEILQDVSRYVVRFSQPVSAQTAVIEAATGGVAGAMANAADKDAQQALVTDGQISAAVNTVFVTLLR